MYFLVTQVCRELCESEGHNYLQFKLCGHNYYYSVNIIIITDALLTQVSRRKSDSLAKFIKLSHL